MSKEVTLEDIVSLCKRRGFIFQGSEIYGGLAGTWDYGPLGVSLKKNLTDLWWKTFVEDREDMVGVDAAILMNPRTWKASGHVDTFTDPLVECSECKGRFRADKIDLRKCPTCGAENSFGEARQFNLMFKSFAGPLTKDIQSAKYKVNSVEMTNGDRIDSEKNDSAILYQDSSKIYLRPETAQGIFTNFKNVVDTLYPDVPFGIAQIGKAFRNEISPRDFVFRSREFNQMEIEYFINEKDWQERFEKWRTDILSFLKEAGVDVSKVKEAEVSPEDLAHYSKRTIDYEFEYPHGADELLGLAYRTDFDLQNIQRESGKNMEYRPKDGSEPFVPHVIEPSFGVERLIMAVLCSAYTEDEVNGEKRIYLKFPAHIAPVKYCVSPLLKNKLELVEKAREVYSALKKKHGTVMWDDNGNIGKR
ncbi:glycine--tRNA ligase, partial [Candidatus Saccharibacteria bacterium]|nr:glycine--tRNA ligase [Candidatus Saccharibacteria bacterium]